MKNLKKILFYQIVFWGYLTTSSSLSAEEVNNDKKDLEEEPFYQDPPEKPLTAEEIKRQCELYNGKVISYFDELYQVKGCQRIRVSPGPHMTRLLKKKTPIIDVSSTTIKALPLHIEKVEKISVAISCSQITNKYITYTFEKMYWVEKSSATKLGCHKREFPDWESYMDHRSTRKKTEIKVLDEENFYSIPVGPHQESVFNQLESLRLKEEADIIPISDACKGLGLYVSYYSEVFMVNKLPNNSCSLTKLEEEKSKKIGLKNTLRELSPSQYMSIPIYK